MEEADPNPVHKAGQHCTDTKREKGIMNLQQHTRKQA